MTEKSSEPLSATAVFLIISGVALLIAAMVSTQWLEARVRYDDDAYGAGLFTKAASSGAQFVAVVCLGTTGALAVLGLVWRFLLTLSLGFAMVAGAAASAWILDARAWQVGRAYPFAMFALLVLIMGLAAGVSSTRSVGPKSKGSFVDGQKHGRWYVYDDGGDCVSMEDWEHGVLVSSKPVGRS
jgi:hypothetical protein